MWEYNQPVKLLFGNGVMDKIGGLLAQRGLDKGILISDPFFVKSGLAKKVMDGAGGRLQEIFSDVEPNPTVTNIDDCAKMIREKGSRFALALGGGSALDCAKAACSVCTTGDSIAKYHGTGVALPAGHLPLVAVPTTSGTGSEVTCISVVTDRATGKKAPINCENFFPTLALIDPLLTHSVPPQVTASTGLDVLCHAMEGFWSKGHQPICDALALHATRLVFAYLPLAYRSPGDPAAREKMSEASVMAGLAFTLPKTTACHACSFPLTNWYHIPHGEACALTLDTFARLNASAQGGRLQEFARQLGFADVEAMAGRIAAMKREMGMRTDLRDLHLSDGDIGKLVEASHHPNMGNNPVEVTDDILYEMYRGFCG